MTKKIFCMSRLAGPRSPLDSTRKLWTSYTYKRYWVNYYAELLLFSCLFPLQMHTTYFLKKKVNSSLFTRPRLSVFRISYLRVASSNRSILALNIKEINWFKKSCYTWNYGQVAVKYCYPARDKKRIRCRCKFPFLSIHMYAFEKKAFSITSWLWRVF